MYYIDMHNHLLPGVDDGSVDMKMSKELVELEYKEGVRKIICTPHYIKNNNNYSYEQLDEIFEDFKKMATEMHSDLEVYLGNEVLYDDGILDDIRGGMVHTMAGSKYILVEFNIRLSYGSIYEAMRNLINLRLRPIIAHVERYKSLVGNEDRIEELKNMGVYLQMNTESVGGSAFDAKSRWCTKLLKQGYIDFISTDAHDLVNRTPDMADAVKWIKKKCGEDELERMLWDNSETVIRNGFID